MKSLLRLFPFFIYTLFISYIYIYIYKLKKFMGKEIVNKKIFIEKKILTTFSIYYKS